MHQVLVDFIEKRFSNVTSGHQGDSWIWITGEGDKVEIDTFSAMHHQIKSPFENSQLVYQVIDALATEFSVRVLPVAEPEPHED